MDSILNHKNSLHILTLSFSNPVLHHILVTSQNCKSFYKRDPSTITYSALHLRQDIVLIILEVLDSSAGCNVVCKYPGSKYFKAQKRVKHFHYRPGQALSVPGGRGSQISRQSAHEVGKVVSRTHRPLLPPENIPGTHFC
jgi:hypothetical protein